MVQVNMCCLLALVTACGLWRAKEFGAAGVTPKSNFMYMTNPAGIS